MYVSSVSSAFLKLHCCIMPIWSDCFSMYICCAVHILCNLALGWKREGVEQMIQYLVSGSAEW